MNTTLKDCIKNDFLDLFYGEFQGEVLYEARLSQNFSFWESNLRFMGKSGL
jgi:hypothetical protein